MPEEKKDKKVVVAGAEGAKKDSFTFSDKIKNSKPAASKSFANRISSKIGSDGKPKKTLFERTKRDAPFFIAAIVALLLLPFLYKYSGSVEDNPAIVTPGEDNVEFNPNARSGFDSIGDPEGQIAQLSGRDSMDLIVGFGSKKTEEEDPFRYDQFDRSGMDDTSYSSANNRDEEYNTTNEYRIRKKAPAATRAAFKKTPIGSLRSAGLASRSGGKLGVGMWGGGLKQAANKVKGDAPKSSPKPVSLQPLQAAGKPSRSYFGQGAAAEARRSKDAMSKANAMQALMDAQMKPVEPGKIGGIAGGDFGGPGGGNGNLERKFAFNGKEPWWWDMMKKRSQMEWEAKFNRKWDWIKWGDKLAQNILGGILNCLITGEDDGAMGSMFGVRAGSGEHETCAKMDAETFEKRYNIPLTKDNCRSVFWESFKKDGIDPWDGGDYADTSLGFIGKRLDCLSKGLGASWNRLRSKDMGSLAEANACQTFAMDGIYKADFSSSKNKDWKVYHYVVGIPTGADGRGIDAYYAESDPQKQQKLLAIGYFAEGTVFRDYEKVQNRKDFVPLFVESVAIKAKKVDAKKSAKEVSGIDDKVSFKGYWGTGGTAAGTCGHFENVPFEQAKARCKKMSFLCKSSCLEQISSQIKGKDKSKVVLSIMQEGSKTTTVSYHSFLAILRDGGFMGDSVDIDAKSRLNLASKGGKQGTDWITGARCAYPLVRISCENFANTKGSQMDTAGKTLEGVYPFAHLGFSNGMSNPTVYDKMKRRFMVSYSLQGEDNSNPDAITTDNTTSHGQFYVVPHMQLKPYNGSWRTEDTGSVVSIGTAKQQPGNYQVVATNKNVTSLIKDKKRVVLTWEVRQCDVDTLLTDGSSINDGGCHFGNLGIYNDKGERTGSKGQDKFGTPVSSATCVYYQGGDVLGGDDRNGGDDDNNPVTDDCNNDPEKSAVCCAKLRPGYTYDPAHSPKCYQKSSGEEGEPVVLPLATTVSNVVTEFARRPVDFPQGRGKVTSQVFGACSLNRIDGQVIYNNPAAQAYVNGVLASVNRENAFTQADTTIVHDGNITVANLVDALTLAYQQNPQAKVPQEVVCSLGKTIGYYSRDPHVRSSNNMFGAFAAYIDENSSFFPANKNADGNNDLRFMGCPTQGKLVHKDYHYGHYNWNHYQFADDTPANGPEGRSAYLAVLAGERSLPKQNGPFYWGRPGDFPLAAIGQSLSFRVDGSRKTAAQLRNYNDTIDDYNRKRYHEAYKLLFRNLRNKNIGCGLSGDMNVADALEYIGRVCSNGPSAKPSNGGAVDCGHRHKESQVQGASLIDLDE